MNAFVDICGIFLFEFLQDTDFDLTGVTILRDSTDDFDRHPVMGLNVDGLYDFAESPLAQEANGAISVMDYVIWYDDVVALLIVTRNNAVGCVHCGRAAAAGPRFCGGNGGLLL